MKPASNYPVSMPNSEPTIKCSNPHCVASNNFNRRFCQRCKTPVIKRYLWAIGEKASYSETANGFKPQEKIIEQNAEWVDTNPHQNKSNQKQEESSSERYFAISDRIFCDTQPGETPQIPDKIPEEIVSYLQLFTYFPHIPQVYGQLDGTQIWLLDYGTVPVNRQGKLTFSNLLPQMTSLWNRATSCRQVNWLRQIAGLWKPLSEKKMAATLINPELIRVNSSFIQLLELEPNGETTPTLQDLGKLWQEWSSKANVEIRGVLIELSKRVKSGAIDRIEQIIAILDRILELCSHSREYSYEIFAISDSGPTRNNNQDTAYPYSETPVKNDAMQQSLAIVCDGVGGHEGGEIASQETVDYLYDRVSAIPWNEPDNTPKNILQQLHRFTNEANDAISKRNDSEKRQERQRMGTTLVMTLAHNHEVYLTHVGDSRIYLITRNSCHQLTTDDDLASREVRLGYAVYRDALRYPSAGALIQALGMRDSAALHPNLQRLVVDDDCLFLLCSDGLSDFDRVEQYWRDVIMPVLNNKLDITKAVETLIKIGNERNGHDNVTAALVHCQVRPKLERTKTAITWSEIAVGLGDLRLWTDKNIAGNSKFSQHEAIANVTKTPSKQTTTQVKAQTQLRSVYRSSKLQLLLVAMTLSSIVLVSLGILIYAYTRDRGEPQDNYLQSPTIINEP